MFRCHYQCIIEWLGEIAARLHLLVSSPALAMSQDKASQTSSCEPCLRAHRAQHLQLWYFLTLYQPQLKGSEPKLGTIEQCCKSAFHTDAILHLANTNDYLYCIKCCPSIFYMMTQDIGKHLFGTTVSAVCHEFCTVIRVSNRWLKIRQAKTETGGNQSMQKTVENLRLVLITSIAN